MKPIRIWFLIQVILITFGVITFIIEMLLLSEQHQPGWLFALSMLSFLAGIIVYVFRAASWIVGLGVCLFLLLLTLAIILTGSDNETIKKIGGLTVPFSIFFFVGWIFWFFIWTPKFKKQRLLKYGVSAPGIILDFQQTGTSIEKNGNFPKYLTIIFVEVKPTGAPIFQSVAKEMLAEHEFAKLQKGMQVIIRYNPDNLKNITLES